MRIAVGAALGLVAVAAVAAPAWATMPPNDVRSQTHRITSRAIDGLRAVAYDEDAIPVASVNGLVIPATAGDDTGDPPFVRPPAPTGDPTGGDVASNCPFVADAGFAIKTLWYQIVPTISADVFPERTMVTIDTAGTGYNPVIEIFARALPPPWNSGDAVPSNIIACSQGSGAIPAYVSFVAAPNVRYYAIVGSLGSGGQLYLNMRESDVQAPALTVTADNLLPDRGSVTTFGVDASDAGSGLHSIAVNVSFPSARTGRLTPLPFTGVCPATGPVRGSSFCTVGSGAQIQAVKVKWPYRPGDGRVRVVATDVARNSSPAAYTLKVRDRTAPKVGRGSHAERLGATGARVVGYCNEAGRMIAQITNASGTGPRPRSAKLHRHHKSYRGIRRFASVGHGFFTVKITCQDTARNQTPIYTFLFIP